MKSSAFTFVEVLVAIFLVGLVVVALLVTNRALTNSNSAGLEISTAEFLIEQIKELTALLPADDLDDFASASPFSPPINADSQPLSNFSAYTQQVAVQDVDASDFLTADPNSPVVRVTVQVFLSSKLISEQNWIRARY